MKHDSMVEALRTKKPGALDITITIGQPQGAEVGEEPLEDEIGVGEGLMGEDMGGAPDEIGLGDESDLVDEEEAERRELNLAPTAPEMSGDIPPEMKSDENSEREMIQGELEKANFGKGSLMARKKNELSKTRV